MSGVSNLDQNLIFSILISKCWPLGEGFQGLGPQVRLQHAEISPGTNSEAIGLDLRSNFNSRGVHSRELRRVLGHSSESSQ